MLSIHFKLLSATSLMVQWIRIHLPVQGKGVQYMGWEDNTRLRATKPIHHNYCGPWAWSQSSATKPRTAMKSGLHSLQLDKALTQQWGPNAAKINEFSQFSSVAQPRPTLCNPMNHSVPGFRARLPCPSPTPGVYWNSCPLCWWCHPTISSSVVTFSSCLQSFPASGSLQMSQFFASVGQSIRESASASVLPMNIQDWFPLGWTDWISLQSKGLSRLFSNTTGQKHQFFGAQLSL